MLNSYPFQNGDYSNLTVRSKCHDNPKAVYPSSEVIFISEQSRCLGVDNRRRKLAATHTLHSLPFTVNKLGYYSHIITKSWTELWKIMTTQGEKKKFFDLHNCRSVNILVRSEEYEEVFPLAGWCPFENS